MAGIVPDLDGVLSKHQSVLMDELGTMKGV